MPRGKNYVNQNTGMKLKGKDQVKELCFYGNACERKGCIYRHDRKSKIIEGNQPKSNEPCMAYLAGLCSFTDTTCRKYHPPTDDEINILLQKYQRIPCRFTIHCKTKGCLYMHPDPNTGTYPMINTIPLPPQLLLLNQYNNNNNNINNNRNVEPNLLDPNLFPPLQSNNNKDGNVDVTQQQQQSNPVVSSSTPQQQYQQFPQQQQHHHQQQQPRQLYQQQSHMTTVIPNHNTNTIPSQQQLLTNTSNNINNNNNQYDDVTPYCTFVPTASLKNATGSLIPTAPIQYRKQVQHVPQVSQVSKQLRNEQQQHNFNRNNSNNESLNIQAKEFLPSNYTNSSRP